jgi:hypothetical protein
MSHLENILIVVAHELDRATALHGNFHSLHEGYAVLKEEVDELWDEIKKREPDKNKVANEAVQVAAMAVRLIKDCCGTSK